MPLKTTATSSDKFRGFLRDVRRVLLADFTPRQPYLRIANLDKLTGDNKDLIVSQLKTVFDIFTSSEGPIKTRRQTAALTSQIFESQDDTSSEPNTPHIVVDITSEQPPTEVSTTLLAVEDLCRLINSFRSNIDPTADIPAIVRHLVDCLAIPESLLNLGPNFESSPIDTTMNTSPISTAHLPSVPTTSVTGNIPVTSASDPPTSRLQSSTLTSPVSPTPPSLTFTPSTQGTTSEPHPHQPPITSPLIPQVIPHPSSSLIPTPTTPAPSVTCPSSYPTSSLQPLSHLYANPIGYASQNSPNPFPSPAQPLVSSHSHIPIMTTTPPYHQLHSLLRTLRCQLPKSSPPPLNLSILCLPSMDKAALLIFLTSSKVD